MNNSPKLQRNDGDSSLSPVLRLPSSVLRPLSPVLRPPSSVHRPAGFTLVELLVVITLIAALMGILLGAAQWVVKAGRQRKAEATAVALQGAIATYRHEYGRWPVSSAMNTTYGSADSYGGRVVGITNALNYLVFDMLRASTDGSAANADNPKNIQFLDDSTVFSLNNANQRTPRHLLRNTGDIITPPNHPIIYVDRNGLTRYYSVTIWIEQEKVQVSL